MKTALVSKMRTRIENLEYANCQINTLECCISEILVSSSHLKAKVHSLMKGGI